MNPLLSRKFILAMATLCASTALMAFDKLEDGVYATIIVATVGAYLTANVTQKMKATP